MADEATLELVTIRLVGLPLQVHARSTEHNDELMREFTYIRAQAIDPDAPTVPAKLLDLVDELNDRYAGFTAGSQAELDAALGRGQESIDLEYNVPPDVSNACVHLGELLDAADEYCQQGTHLLTLASPEEAVAYRRWFLDEFVRQVAGSPPRPWAAISA